VIGWCAVIHLSEREFFVAGTISVDSNEELFDDALTQENEMKWMPGWKYS